MASLSLRNDFVKVYLGHIKRRQLAGTAPLDALVEDNWYAFLTARKDAVARAWAKGSAVMHRGVRVFGRRHRPILPTLLPSQGPQHINQAVDVGPGGHLGAAEKQRVGKRRVFKAKVIAPDYSGGQ